WVSFYRQKWIIASLNNCVSQIDGNIWKSSPNNTNVVEAAHALRRKLNKEKFTAIRIHQQYNVPNHGRDKSLIGRNVLSNKCKVIIINSEDSNESDQKESLTINKLEYQKRLLALKERELALREREAKVHSVELANLEKIKV
ncbi:29685_t:CDS:2, partial [Racocetra persica]